MNAGSPSRASALRAAAAVLLLACTTTAAPADAPKSSGWALRRPSTEKAVFRGMVNHDSAGVGAGAMLYPAPNAVGLFAALLTHGLINESAKKAQKDKLQADADAVLGPYKPTLEGLTHEQLLNAGLDGLREPARPRLVSADDAGDGDTLIETVPVFMMPADQRAIVLDNALRIVPSGGGEGTTQVVRVISAPLSVADAGSAPEGAWLADGGARLARVSAALLGESIAIAQRVSVAMPTADLPQRTVRFLVGGVERMERAQLIEERCDRLLLRTLRGHLMSVPSREIRCPAAGP